MPDTPRPELRALLYRLTAFGIEWQIVRLELVIPLREFGWRLVGVDPKDEADLAKWDADAARERAQAEQAARRQE